MTFLILGMEQDISVNALSVHLHELCASAARRKMRVPRVLTQESELKWKFRAAALLKTGQRLSHSRPRLGSKARLPAPSGGSSSPHCSLPSHRNPRHDFHWPA